MAYPSVTAILAAVGLAPDFSRVSPQDLEAARRRGSAVHAALEAHHYGLPVELDEPWKPYLAAYERFLLETGHIPEISEFTVTSERWRFVGHPDRKGYLQGKRCLLDWKTADALEIKPVSYQLAGYKLAYEEEHPKEPIGLTAAVQLKRDGTYRLHVIDPHPALPVFQAAVIIVHARGDINHDRDSDRYLD